jgi:vacuolar-type H+-ATPase subunit I/STV1
MSFKSMEEKKIELRQKINKLKKEYNSEIEYLESELDNIEEEENLHLNKFELDDLVSAKKILIIKNIDNIKENNKQYSIDDIINIIINGGQELFERSCTIETNYDKFVNIKLCDDIFNRYVKRLTENEIDICIVYIKKLLPIITIKGILNEE